MQQLPVVVERAVLHEALGRVRRPEAHQDDEDERSEQVEAEPDEAGERPEERHQSATALPLPRLLDAERALVLDLDLALVGCDVLEIETRDRLGAVRSG